MIDKLTENDTDAEVATLGPRPSKGDALKRNLRIGSQPSIDQLAHDASADADQTGSRISAAVRPPTEIRVYEFGVRLDPVCVAAADDQIRKARQLYNEIVAALRSIHAEMTMWVLEHAGPEVRSLHEQVTKLNEQFANAKAINDGDLMRGIAAHRRDAWCALVPGLAATRNAHAAELRETFYSRVGVNRRCETYSVRRKAVEAGLGWATANDVLDRALVAWRSSMKLGKAPRFARGDDRLQDCLSLQFTAAGGVDVSHLLDGSNHEFSLQPPEDSGRRRYGAFTFRLGAAASGSHASGTVQLHRELPAANATHVRLVRRRHANRMKWALQFVLKLREPVRRGGAPLGTLAAVHFGWAADVTGRRVAGIADAGDPSLARLVQLPSSIEADLQRASGIQATRDKARDESVLALKSSAQVMLPISVAPELLESIRAELDSVRLLPTQHIAAKRFYSIQALMRKASVQIDWLSGWVAQDRKRWQATVGLARRARRRRRQFYRELALDLARRYTAVVIEPLDLKKAAQKTDEATGERSEFARKARAGRTVAALFEFESEIRKAAADHGRAVFDLSGETTVSRCSHCGNLGVRGNEQSSHEVVCDACGSTTDRKLAGAAMAWQTTVPGIEDRVLDFHARSKKDKEAAIRAAAARKHKMAEGRQAARAARTSSNAESGDGLSNE